MENLEKYFGDALGIIYEGEEFAEDAKPLLRKWEFRFPKRIADPRGNSLGVTKSFCDFLEARSLGKLDVVGEVVLNGDVYGRKGFDDGDNIITSGIVSFERINKGNLNGVPRDLMCANTESGSKYYFYSDDHSASMFLLLGAAIHMN